MTNLEAKFRLANLVTARARAETIGFIVAAVLVQRDTFFAVANGKLKLREEASGASLIHYQRETAGRLELSNYTIAAVTDAAVIRAILASALGIVAEVRKRRTLMLRGNIRLHLDEVEQLGTFGEIEAVLEAESGAEAERYGVDEILTALAVESADLIGVSYFELMSPVRH